MNSTIHIERLPRDRLGDLRRALTEEGMPVDGIESDDCAFFRFQDDGETFGFAGLQGNGTHLLLRSVWIKPSQRRLGRGIALIGIIEREARARGCTALHLLTTTASAFFAGLGYQIADRATAPGEIAAMPEFAGLCPASAAYLVKKLDIAPWH